MIKALRVTMIVYAALGILVGLASLFFPRQLCDIYGYEGSGHMYTLTVALGVGFISASIFLLIAARDPLKHILWVKYAIVAAILQLAAHIYSVILGYANFGEQVMDMTIYAIFTVAFLAFYPWHRAKPSSR